MRDAQGKIPVWIGSNTEIHERKETEAELRRANEDLQQFAYSASHDLQEPIRNVAVYSEMVAKRYHSRLDADGQQNSREKGGAGWPRSSTICSLTPERA
jgi:signal transduction histidine kinase